ncbi:PREDICTED: disease resistance protein TAO1-like [Nelumbo nucifera]|uniref:Disease resistance protein TAO1-like n=1 Tax=Nelumbo nucifera TaxID=4432 RepID=A0A1U8AL25_NELNU|nr:PREDICTED: disease resistance protein TAO1-like [Nelumbo nucifera]
MCDLRLLQINYVHLNGGYEHLSKNLRLLCWHGFPSESLPANFGLEKVVALDLQHSKIKQLWKGEKSLMQLKFLNLCCSNLLVETPVLSSLPNLERLLLKKCRSLVSVHKSIGCLQKLVVLDLEYCLALTHLPRSICYLTSLEYLSLHACKKLNMLKLMESVESLKALKFLDLSHCPSLTKTPSFLGLCNLEKLIIRGCENLAEVHESIGCLDRKLVLLDLRFCRRMLRELPNSICKLKYLRKLDLLGCENLCKLPEELGNMERLMDFDATCTGIKHLPPSIVRLKNLINLNLSSRNVKALGSGALPPVSFSSFVFLRSLDLSGCRLSEYVMPSDIGNLSSLRKLELSRNNFRRLPDSIESLSQLRFLTLDKCTNLQSLPMLPSGIESLSASDCQSLTTLSNLGCLTSLVTLVLNGAKFCSLPDTLKDFSLLTSLHLSDCTNLKALPELPSSLMHLHANGCTSMERLPNLSNNLNLRSLVLRCCNKLVEIQGLQMLHLELIDLAGCKELANTWCNFLFKELFGGAKIEIFLPGSKVPKWFSHRRSGSSLSFDVPVDHKIQGLIVCAIYGGNKVVDLTSDDEMWLCSIPHTDFRFPFESGDKILVSARSLTVQVKEWGVHLGGEPRDKSSEEGGYCRVL